MRRVRLPKWFLNFICNVYLSPRPFWMLYHPTLHRIKGHEVRRVLDSLRKGDLMVRRWNGYLNSFFTPGYWAHAGIYAGDNAAIHALGEGVVKEDILDFCRTDSIAVLRIAKGNPDEAVRKAHELVGSPYDYNFQSGDAKYYCSELCDVCYNNMFKDEYSTVAGNRVLTPGAIRESDKVSVVIEIKH